jgi:hypothetical protein
MLGKECRIHGHFYENFQRRARNHCSRLKHRDIENKVNNLLKKVDETDLITCKDVFFLKTSLSREGNRPFYLLLLDKIDYYLVLSIYTQDMFNKDYPNKK